MTTVAQLIEQCSGMLHSYTGVIETSTFLTVAIDADDTTFTVQHPTRILQGVIEVDEELMLVSDQGTTNVTLFPFGRGANATTAVGHALNTRVVNDPLIPKARLFEEVKAVIRQLHDIDQVKTTSLQSEAVENTYPLPADCKRVLRIQWETTGPQNEWPNATAWHWDPNADLTTFPTGKSVTIDGILGIPGSSVQVTYAADLPVPAASTDDLETIGIPAELHDVIRFGVCWRAMQMMAPAKLNARATDSPETNGVSPTSIKTIAELFFGMFSLRRDEERKRRHLLYPPRPHRVR